MAYMHELVHVCHPCCPFFGNLTNAKGYPSIFIFGAVALAPVNRNGLILFIEKCPETIKNEKKNFCEKYFL